MLATSGSKTFILEEKNLLHVYGGEKVERGGRGGKRGKKGREREEKKRREEGREWCWAMRERP